MKNKFKCTQNPYNDILLLIKVHFFLFAQKKSEYDSRQLVQKLGEWVEF